MACQGAHAVLASLGEWVTNEKTLLDRAASVASTESSPVSPLSPDTCSAPSIRPPRCCVRQTDRHRPGESLSGAPSGADTAGMGDRNVLGGELEPCGTDPVTGFYRDGCCSTGPEDQGSHTICAVVTAEFLDHQRRIGNDLSTPMPQYHFPGLVPGDRWCVTAANWLRAHHDGAAAHVVLASTHERALEIVPLAALKEHAVDVPANPGALEDQA